jgi:hypothetical protein
MLGRTLRSQVAACVAFAVLGTGIIYAMWPQAFDGARAQERKGFEVLATSDTLELLTFKVGDDRLYIARDKGYGVSMVVVSEHEKEEDK